MQAFTLTKGRHNGYKREDQLLLYRDRDTLGFLAIAGNVISRSKESLLCKYEEKEGQGTQGEK